jgi:hypothetical protein
MPIRPDVRSRAVRRSPNFAAAGCVSVVAALLHPPPAVAQTPVRPPHIRPEDRDGRRFVEEAVGASPTVRDLVEQLQQSDVYVYLRFRAFSEIGLDGRLRFLSAAAGSRFVVIELACIRPRFDQIATFGHELHHALEIAAAPAVVSVATLAAYYQRIGTETIGAAGTRTFETRSARVTANIVRKEVFAAPERRTDGQ